MKLSTGNGDELGGQMASGLKRHCPLLTKPLQGMMPRASLALIDFVRRVFPDHEDPFLRAFVAGLEGVDRGQLCDEDVMALRTRARTSLISCIPNKARGNR